MNKKQLLIIIITFVLDQISKVLVSSYCLYNQSLRIIKNFFYITPNNNYGAAFGILNNNTFFLILTSIIALIILIRYCYGFKSNKKNNIAFGLLMGGILGNLSDRIFLGYVRDFLDFKLFSYNYPIFNLADSFIVIGVILLIIAIFMGEDKNGNRSNKKQRKNR